MLDDVRVEPSSSLDPVEGMQTTSDSANPVSALQKPVEITASDSKGNLVDLEGSDTVGSEFRTSIERENMADPPETPTESLRPGTAGTDIDMIMSTPQRGRRSAAPSPDSALVEPVVSRSSTPEPMNINPDQPLELPEGVTELTLSDPSQTKSETSLPGAEGLIQLGAALPITLASPTKTAEPSVVASSVLEDEDAAASIRGPPTFVRALVVSQPPPLESLSSPLTNPYTAVTGWCCGWTVSRPDVLPDRHHQNTPAISAGIREGWRL